MRPIDLLVIHCTATPNGKAVSRETIRQGHLARGFSDIGYHYLVQVDGSLIVGRPEEQVGAHAAVKGHHYNQTSLGIALIGGTGNGSVGLYTQAQWDSLKLMIESLMDRFEGARVCGHRDLSPDLDGDGQVEPCEWIKLCPCFDVSAWMAAKRTPAPQHIFREKV